MSPTAASPSRYIDEAVQLVGSGPLADALVSCLAPRASELAAPALVLVLAGSAADLDPRFDEHLAALAQNGGGRAVVITEADEIAAEALVGDTRRTREDVLRHWPHRTARLATSGVLLNRISVGASTLLGHAAAAQPGSRRARSPRPSWLSCTRGTRTAWAKSCASTAASDSTGSPQQPPSPRCPPTAPFLLILLVLLIPLVSSSSERAAASAQPSPQHGQPAEPR